MSEELTNDEMYDDEGGYLSLDAIRNADDTQYEDVEVPEWGGKVRIRSVTKGEHQGARRASIKRGELNPDLLELNLLVAGMVEPKLTTDDAGVLKRKNAGVVERVLRKILTLSGLTLEAQEDLDKQFPD